MKALGSLLVALAALAAWPLSAAATLPGHNGEIAFVASASSDDGYGHTSFSHSISAMRPFDGSSVHELIGCSAKDATGACGAQRFLDPAYSPDGQTIAFRLGDHLALMNRDGSNLRSLPRITTLDEDPTWAPDGVRIAFVGHTPTGTTQLYTVHSDGSRPRRVGPSGVGSPSWSSRNRIAFEHRGGIYVVRPSGARLRRLVRVGTDPDWSPHASRLVYVRRGQIYVARADGHHRHKLRLEEVPSGLDSPVWSPNGRWIAFHSPEGDADRGIWVSRPNGKRSRQVAAGGYSPEGSSDNASPAWQPLP